MTTTVTVTWHEANQRYLMAALALVRQALEQHRQRAKGDMDAGGFTSYPSSPGAPEMLRQAAADLPAPAALDTLCAAFNLSPFERDILLACAGVELDASFAALCGAAQGEGRRAHPTFSLLLAALPQPHWSALMPTAPLRYWRLIEVGAGDALTVSPLRIDERIVHYLTGLSYLDERLRGFVEPVRAPHDLPASHQLLTQRITALWSHREAGTAWPVIQLCGGVPAVKRRIAAAACAALGLQLHVLRAGDVPGTAGEREAFGRLWEREAILAQSGLFIDADEADGTSHLRAATTLLEHLQGWIIVGSREPMLLPGRPTVRLDVHKPTAAEQRALWRSALGPMAQHLNGQLDTIVTQFDLEPHRIWAASVEVLSRSETRGAQTAETDLRSSDILWDACRVQARPRLDDLAQRLEPAATWDDLVLPAPQRDILRDIAAHVRRRATVYETWGFAAKGVRGLGISVLFAGPSGTGKTMAAEVLAHELRLDLYRIDLSQVVSKYIGETEKNLRRVFDAAEEGGAILLFDEADALFGKRSEVKDSHDRYANIEISYLLQRMEAYRGLAILTTNMKSALDQAFLRRLRFVVQFPFPDAEQRAEIWRRIWPSQTPTERLDVEKLARLNVAGGHIRNIALKAAFLAADAGEPVCMTHVLRAARSEYLKLEKPLTEAEIGGWI
jgi:hypothetical protein